MDTKAFGARKTVSLLLPSLRAWVVFLGWEGVAGGFGWQYFSFLWDQGKPMFFLTMLVLCVLIPLQVAMYRAIRQAGLENERLRGRVVTAQEVLLSKRKYVVGLLPKSLDPSVSALAGKALIDCTEHGILNDPARDGDVLHLVGMAQRGGHETWQRPEDVPWYGDTFHAFILGCKSRDNRGTGVGPEDVEYGLGEFVKAIDLRLVELDRLASTKGTRDAATQAT